MDSMKSGQEKQTILVVDDVPENIELLSAPLREQYRIKVALDGENALRIARSDDKPDLILLDIMMPGMDGYAVCQALKANPDTAGISVIFVTAMAEVEEEKKGLDLGAADYITKPISQPIVMARVKTHLALKKAADDTQRAQRCLSQALTEFELILENASLGIATVVRTAEARRITRVNRAMEQIFGYERGELEGLDTRVLALTEEDYRIFGQVFDGVLEHGQRHQGDQLLRRKDGQIITTHLVGVAIDPKDFSKGVIWLVEDISERCAAQKQLLAANAELSEALETVQRTYDELMRSEKLATLGSLVAGIAHELNTPIGNALMVASTMHDEVRAFRTALPNGIKRSTLEYYLEDTSNATDIVLRNLRRAGDLIGSFKQVAVDQTSSKRRCFDVQEIVDEIIVTLHPILKRTPFLVESEIEEDLQMDSYPGPLGQVLTNLVNNAIVHGLEGRLQGDVRIVARRLDEDTLELKVVDDGCGMPPSELAKIFAPFYTTRMGEGGTGLGLSIVHSIVTSILGGRVTVESEPGCGTTFTMTLPVVAPRQDTAD